MANAGKLDLDWVRREWQALADRDDPRTAQFEQLVKEYYIDPTPGATAQ